MRSTTLPPGLILGPLVVAALAACGVEGGGQAGGTVAGSGVTVRDSAGIRIVENHDSAWTEATRWRVADEPDLRIGSLDGGVAGTDWGQFILVRSAGERIVVFDGMSTTIRVFDEAGAHLRTFDLGGEGPTEVQSFGQTSVLSADTVVVWGLLSDRIVRVALDSGERTAIATPRRGWEDTRGLLLNGWLPDASFLMVAMPQIDAMEVGRRVLHGRFFRFSSDGTLESEFDGLPMMEAWRESETVLGPVSFAPNGATVVSGDEVWHAFPDEGFELSRIDASNGELREIVRVASPREPVTGEMRERIIDQQRALFGQLFESDSRLPAEATGRLENMMEGMLDGMQFADSLPPFQGFRAGTDGTLWVPRQDAEQRRATMAITDFENMPDLPEFAARHVVIDTEGRWLGTVETPVGFQPQEFGRDYVLGTRNDEFDVPYVERYRIIKP